MTASNIVPATFAYLLLLVFATAQFVQPPPTATGPSPIYTNGASMTVKWDSNYSRVNLVLWNNYVEASGSQDILYLPQNESPDPHIWSDNLTVGLDQGSSFQLVVYSLDDDNSEFGPQHDSCTFDIVPSPAPSTSRSSTTAVTSLLTSLAGATETPDPTQQSNSGPPASSNVAAALASASSAAYRAGQAASTGGGAVSHSATVGLGVGLGLGVPLLIVGVAAATYFLCVSSAAARQRMREGRTGERNAWGTETEDAPPFSSEHKG